MNPPSPPVITLKPKRAQPFYARHPWLFAGVIARVDGDPADGDAVAVHSHEGRFIAWGLLNSRSKIRVRLYSWNLAEPIDEAFFRDRLLDAVAMRDGLGLRGENRGARLVYSEGDGLSGLVVDEFASYLVVQATALGITKRLDMLTKLLNEIVRPRGIFLRTEAGMGKLEGLQLEDGLLDGAPPPDDLSIVENGAIFRVNLLTGQKTGYYLDQRDNRKKVAALASGKRVLDAFCYSGGFGIQAALAGASAVDCVDSSNAALQLTRDNAERNGLSQVRFHKSDVFDFLENAVANGEQYDVVVLDPPKFARDQRSVDEALRGYHRLQKLGIELLVPGGFLVNCCCSGLITSEMLVDILATLAAVTRRDVRIVDYLHQAADHPVSATCLEGRYLKGTVAQIGAIRKSVETAPPLAG